MSNRALTVLFGTFTWTAPAWLRRAASAIHSHRRTSIFLFLSLFLLVFGTWQAWRWYQSRPKPERIAVTVAPIPVTPLTKELHPANLVVHFSQSAAPLDRIGKPAGDGIRLDPPTAGAWSWISDSQLVFTPQHDWPADQKYTVTFDRKYFPRHVLLDRYQVEVTTPAFAAAIKQTEFYQDPKDPGLRQVVATVEFTHSVNRGEFEKRISLGMLGGSDVFVVAGIAHPGHSSNARRFTVLYGLHDRVAYIRSVPLSLPEREDFMRVVLNEGIATTQGGAPTTRNYESKVRVPDIYSFFQIGDTRGTIVRNDDGDPEQIIIVTTTAAAKPEQIKKALHLSLLPKRNPDEPWQSPREVDDETLRHATPVKFTALPADHEQTTVHAFRIAVEEQGQLYLRVDKGTQAVGGFLLRDNYDAIIPVPVPPREIAIQGTGGILALNGERKISIKSRGVGGHRTTSSPASPPRRSTTSSRKAKAASITRVSSTTSARKTFRVSPSSIKPIALTNSFSANYSSFDFSSHLQLPADGGSERGLFFIRAQQWDPVQKRALPGISRSPFHSRHRHRDAREKKRRWRAATSFSFPSNRVIRSPRSSSRLLGKNGVAIARGTSGPDGRVSFPAFDKETRERTPVAFVARLGQDVAFMPFERADRVLDFSRFDVGGVENMRAGPARRLRLHRARRLSPRRRSPHRLHRETARLARAARRSAAWKSKCSTRAVMRAQLRKITLPASGFAELTFPTAYESPTGEYQVSLYLIRNGWRDQLLGNTDFQVKEFLPDRMHLTSELSSSRACAAGSIRRTSGAHVTLQNLYGTPASDRRITSQMELSPAAFHFAEYNDYVFCDPLRDAKRESRSQTVDLGETKTDAAGQATIDLGLERFADATYRDLALPAGIRSGRRAQRRRLQHRARFGAAACHRLQGRPRAELSRRRIARTQSNSSRIDPKLNKIAAR